MVQVPFWHSIGNSMLEYVIQALVGHEKGSKVTRQVYTHFNFEDNLTYVNKLDD